MSVIGTTWTINSNVNMYDPCITSFKTWSLSFISNGVTYNSTNGTMGKDASFAYYGSTLVWDSDNGWVDEAYRTIEIVFYDSTYQNTLEAWLNANAVEVVPVDPVDYLTTDVEITSIADAIRSKGGTSSSLVYPTGFVTAINAISTYSAMSSAEMQAGTETTERTMTAANLKAGLQGVLKVTSGDVQLYGAHLTGQVPAVTSSDNGKILKVSSGAWAAETPNYVSKGCTWGDLKAAST